MANLLEISESSQLGGNPHLEDACVNKNYEIENWFTKQWQQHKPPFYGSVDLRNSGYKMSIVDMNFFPGGFNNLDGSFVDLAVKAINSQLEQIGVTDKRILLIPENHTKNIGYLHNVYVLQNVLQQAGFAVEIGSVSPSLEEPWVVDLQDGKVMTYYPVVRNGNKIKTTSGFEPSFILINHDLSAGVPDILMGLEQEFLPPLHAGWFMRKKTNFFTKQSQIITEFSQLVGCDSWLLDAYFDQMTGLDFANRVGLEELADKVDSVLTKIKYKYDEYNVKDEPYVIVKANHGTYGMGIMVVKSKEDILAINRKSRNKMAVIKDGQKVTDVIIQEGVYTHEVIDDASCESVVYMMHDSIVGGFYRTHTGKGNSGNLNSTGAKFIPISNFSEYLSYQDTQVDKQVKERFYSYGVLARLAMLAGSYELESHKLQG